MAEILPGVTAVLQAAGYAIPDDAAHFASVVDLIRARYTTLLDFGVKGRPYFSDDFTIEPAALEKLEMPGARALLGELGERLAGDPEFSESTVEAHLRALAAERGVKAGVLINGSRAALTGQAVGPSAFHLFTAVGRDRAIARLRAVAL